MKFFLSVVPVLLPKALGKWIIIGKLRWLVTLVKKCWFAHAEFEKRILPEKNKRFDEEIKGPYVFGD